MTLTRPIHIVVDGDACPVKKEIAETARAFNVPVLLVSSYDHLHREEEGIQIIQVDRSDQSADLYIANHIARGDIVVTQDYGLAALALSKSCQVLSFRGRIFSDQDIDFLLDSRHHQAKARKAGHYGKGPRKMMDEDRRIFQHKLTKVLQKLQENDRL
ncbi:YaiI/YqxD family protein [Paenibacillus sp. N3/727]|uniref:YaiI/YqxD family protein n=1 Tax=Paenibacillus sp. N3/727 TaxID=2925845 RepID=UPI001F52BC32|nr:YaiI/YqxD family protein [Paenibacillus sp. N3/727]UNK20065.1 YaiI/YqxD family protein [Paenibacillus sp. N3/727]